MTHQLNLGSVRTTTRSHGFTIVELLIVIVVIGILAALVLNSYSGVQRNARNAQTAHAIEAYKKGLMAYAVLNGAYPNYYGCLGQGYPGGTCFGGWSESAGLSNALKTTMGSTLPLGGVGGSANNGPAFWSSAGSFYTLDGVSTAFILYMIDTTGDPNPKCPVGPIISGTGYPNFLTSNPAGATSWDGNQCFIPLPDGTKL